MGEQKEAEPMTYICTTCGSEDVYLEGYIVWNTARQRHEVEGLCDKGHTCETCGDKCSAKMVTLREAEAYRKAIESAQNSAAQAEAEAVAKADAKAAATDTIRHVRMPDLVAYEVPEESPEWRWVMEHACFNHTGNGVEPGVWESMVHVRTVLSEGSAPPLLAGAFQEAKKDDVAYLVFHQ